MSIQRMIDVICNVRDCYETTDASYWTAKDARYFAKQEGWRRYKGLDICPKHEGVAGSKLQLIR